MLIIDNLDTFVTLAWLTAFRSLARFCDKLWYNNLICRHFRGSKNSTFECGRKWTKKGCNCALEFLHKMFSFVAFQKQKQDAKRPTHKHPQGWWYTRKSNISLCFEDLLNQSAGNVRFYFIGDIPRNTHVGPSTQVFLAPSLFGPTRLLKWVVQTDVAFYFMPGAQQQT
jgi:hypothetical protein